MCCRVSIKPPPFDALELLLLAGFSPTADRLDSLFLGFPDGDVEAHWNGEALVLNLNPSISLMSEHAKAPMAAGAMFKIGARLAEEANGELWHLSNVGPCQVERGNSAALVASYPDAPFRFEALCLGFRTLFGEPRT